MNEHENGKKQTIRNCRVWYQFGGINVIMGLKALLFQTWRKHFLSLGFKTNKYSIWILFGIVKTHYVLHTRKRKRERKKIVAIDFYFQTETAFIVWRDLRSLISQKTEQINWERIKNQQETQTPVRPLMMTIQLFKIRWKSETQSDRKVIRRSN